MACSGLVGCCSQWLESVETRRNATVGCVSQYTKTCTSRSHTNTNQTDGMDGRLDEYADGPMEMDRWIDGRMDGK